MGKASDCGCAWCSGSGRPHPLHGYDMDRVPLTRCLSCGERIGDEPYVENLTMARFGQMTFHHRRCLDRVEKGAVPRP